MNEVTKTYPNGEKLVISDDGVSDVNILKARLVKVFTASDGETFEQVEIEATATDMQTDVDSITGRIATLQKNLTQVTNRKATLDTELANLPARIVAEVVEDEPIV